MATPGPDTPPLSDRQHQRFAAAIALLLALGCAWGAVRLAGVLSSRTLPWRELGTQATMNQVLGTWPGQSAWARWSAGLRYRALGDLGPQVSQGCPGWLFYNDGLRPQAGDNAAYARRIALMQHWASLLKAQGVQLLVAVVPDKSRIAAAQLCGETRSARMQARWDDWQMRLRAVGVPSVDLRPALSALPQAYYRTDVHMNPAGAEAAAASIAHSALPLLGGPGPQRFSDELGAAPAPRVGDLIVLAGLDGLPEGWRPPLDQVRPEHIAPVPTGGLLDAGPPVEVLLVGDSNGSRSEFSDRLGRQLGREVWALNQDGGYFSGAMLAALAQRPRWPAGLKLVVWTFSELSLSLPLSPEEQRAAAALP
ncbi:cell division protein FtsQ [Ideonella sp. B508-1]|uniref:alginate O-acetyltransferase AlgX-related protein n=1 Tax=Ideonella sp. B508-1 TaxID=137716 RepID=UPI000475BB1F|nr:cell division protein FtsQ [Ideonella sp. B508-1]